MENPGKNWREKLHWEFIFWLARRLPDCREITPTLSQSLDRKLSVREKITIRLHLYTCGACRNYVSQIKFMGEAFKIREIYFARVAEELATASTLTIEARERMKAALRAASTNDQT